MDMRRGILITFGLLLTTMLQAQSWQPRSWQKYLIGEQVKKESISGCHSVMGSVVVPTPYDPRLFRTVIGSDIIKDIRPYKKKAKLIFGDTDQSQSVFAEQDAATERARMVEGDYDSGFGIFSAILATVADIIGNNLKVKNK